MKVFELGRTALIAAIMLLAMAQVNAQGTGDPATVLITGIVTAGATCADVVPGAQVKVYDATHDPAVSPYAYASTSDSEGRYIGFLREGSPASKVVGSATIKQIRYANTGPIPATAPNGIATVNICLTPVVLASGKQGVVGPHMYARHTIYYITDRQADNGPVLDPNKNLSFGSLVVYNATSSCPSWLGWTCKKASGDDDLAPDGQKVLQRNVRDTGLSAQLSPLLSASGTENAVVLFVHGYNTPFAGGANALGRLGLESITFHGVPILFSWPSAGRVLGYFQDETVAHQARWDLADVIEQITHLPSHPRIVLVAHSMGNFILTEALQIYALRHPEAPADTFATIVFAAADVDEAQFHDVALPVITHMSRDVHMYTSSDDYALRLSECLHGHRSRAGETQSWSSPVAEIDVSKTAPRQDLGHGYIVNSRDVAIDIARVLRSPTVLPHAPSDASAFLKNISWLQVRANSVGDVTGRFGISGLCTALGKLGFS